MNKQSQKSEDKAAPETDGSLTQLCLQVLPIWGRHLARSRTQSEEAVTEMLRAFSLIGPHLEQAVRQSREITDAMVPVDGSVGMTGLVKACEAELAPLAKLLDEKAAAPIQRAIALIKQSVASLEKATEQLPYDAKSVNEKLEQMYVGFQYQDRVNQMMTLLQDDMTRLLQVLELPQSDPQVLAANSWLERLESMYAMAEQRRDHSSAGQAAGAAGSDAETSFF